MAEAIIPPWVRPESPETIRTIDDATIAFQPAFGRGTTQRGIWADPRWGLRRRYRGLRSDEKAAILNALNESRGQLNVLRVTPHTPIRGSFSTTELLSNNTFASGTTSWSAPADGRNTLSASDRVLRGTLAATTQFPYAYQSVAGLTQYAPYVFRSFISSATGSVSSVSRAQVGSAAAGGFDYGSADATTFGMASRGFVTSLGTTAYVHAVLAASSTGLVAGDYFSCPYTSLARCALVDNGVNNLLQSDALENASWSSSNGTTVTTGITAPDGSTNARRIVETATAGSHNRGQAITVTSSAQDLCLAAAIKQDNRPYGVVILEETTGSTRADCFLDFSNGNTTLTLGANWSNGRAFSRSLGNGWWYVAVVARKTNAAIAVNAYVGIATSTAGITYAGNTSNGMYAWRATLATSSVPVRLAATTSSILGTGTNQTGGTLYTKGWPVSTSGLLLTGDWFEFNGELKQLTAPVNSDAAGLAYMQFRPGIGDAPADNDPIIVYEPFGRFIYPAGTRELENLFGIYGDCEMNLEEVYV